MSNSIEIKFSLGSDIEVAMNQLYEMAKSTGKTYYGIFNEKEVNSDMTIDEAYKVVLGMDKTDFKKFEKEEAERMKMRKEEAVKTGKWLIPD